MNFEVIFYPGKTLKEEPLAALVEDLRTVAASCFSEVPYYQALTGKRSDLEKAIIATARSKNGELLGFCSALILEVKGVGKIFHTGLTCVSPKARGKKLTHKLTSKLLTKYLLKESLFKPTWVTNCACVLSSIGNVAKYFEDIYPSPYGPKTPTENHVKIAETISNKYRAEIAINDDAIFNLKNFIFEGSIEGTSFEKKKEDDRFHHRNKELNTYYMNLLDWDRGDEVLQVGKVSILTLPKYYKKILKRKLRIVDSLQQDSYVH